MTQDREQASLILYYLAPSQMDQGHYDQAMLSLQRLQQNLHYSGPRPIFYTPSYYLMGRALEKKRDVIGARIHYEEFLGLWINADDDLPLLTEARVRLANLRMLSP